MVRDNLLEIGLKAYIFSLETKHKLEFDLRINKQIWFGGN